MSTNERFKLTYSECTFWGVGALKELVFVGLGLDNEKGISLQGIKEVKTADYAFLELYTSLLPNFSIKRFEAMVNK